MTDNDGGLPPKIEILIVAQLFPLGQLIATPGALDAIRLSAESEVDYLARHACGDWGELDAEDKESNDRALAGNCGLLSAYTLGSGERIWLITEADRSATTILLPSEY